MGFIVDAETGRRRRVHALIFTAVVSRHMFVWLTYSQTLGAVIAGCEAAWAFFEGVFKVLVPDNLKAVVTDPDAVNPR
jgi:transposase